MAHAPSCFQQTAAEVSLRRIFVLSLGGVLHTARAPPHGKDALSRVQDLCDTTRDAAEHDPDDGATI